ncbi:MAG: PorP/SprF family type IX secretion system membrane protein [Bacteroidota bacterium]
MKKLVFIVCLMIPFLLKAQDPPDLSSYQWNWLYFNPAFAGSYDALSGSMFVRNKFSGSGSSPYFEHLAIHTPLKNDKIGLGLALSSKQEGGLSNPFNSNFELNLNYAYRIWIGGGRLSLGLKAGLESRRTDYSSVSLPDPDDPSFPVEVETKTIPNFGAGALYYNEKYFVALSVPRFLSMPDSSNLPGHSFSDYTFFLSGGYTFNLGSNFKLMPTFFTYYNGWPVKNFMISLNAGLFDEFIWTGVTWKSSNALSFMFDIQVSNQLMIGYAADFSLGAVSNLYSWSHELVLRWEYRKIIAADSPFYY